MRISDWSSDVCSSDLNIIASIAGAAFSSVSTAPATADSAPPPATMSAPDRPAALPANSCRTDKAPALALGKVRPLPRPTTRSEEHTSELQSLMRISYAVFCLKKKTINTTAISQNQLTQQMQDNQKIIN